MRATWPLSSRLALISFPIFTPLFLAGVLRGQTPNTQIDYTGSLMGYYRMEYNETTHLPPVDSFLTFRQDDKNLLLGMGDNFGPEFGAALQMENPNNPCSQAAPPSAITKETAPESLYKDDDRVAITAGCDNVLNFLMHAGFRAIVPGTQDFMYTARWLRDAGLLLSQANVSPKQFEQINNPDHKLNLLGANLRISLKGGGGPKGGGGGAKCPLLFSPNPFSPNSLRCVGDGITPEPLDWLDRLDRLNRSGGNNSTISALDALSTQSTLQLAAGQTALDEIIHDEISILQSAWGARLSQPPPGGDKTRKEINASQKILELAGKGPLNSSTAEALSDSLRPLELASTPDYPVDPDDDKAFRTYRDRLVQILQNLDRRLNKRDLGDCTKNRANGGCFLLTPQARAGAINGLLRTIALEEKDIGYTVAQSDNGGKILIVGVVGVESMNAVSETNLRLCQAQKDESAAGDSAHDFRGCGDRTKAAAPGGPKVVVSDPVAITQALVRGANLVDGPFQSVVVMAQMPHTEAEILSQRVWQQLSLAYASPATPADVKLPSSSYVDIVLSEAESGYGTSTFTLSYPAASRDTHPAPVVTPDPSYSSDSGSYPGAVSRLSIESSPDRSLSMTNQHDGIFTPPTASESQTTVSLLYGLIGCLQNTPAPGQSADDPCLKSTRPADAAVGIDLSSKQRSEFALLEDLQKASQYKADVVLLQSRDVELGAIGPGYTNYDMCNGDRNPRLCAMRSALDRIFWKGDYLEYVAVTGKSLKDLLSASQKLMAQQAQLAEAGPAGQWLISYGIVQSSLTNVTEINQNNEPVWIPVDPACKGQSSAQTTYCIGGTPIADDSYYWLLTTDQLAEDKVIYGTLQGLPPVNHAETDTFVSGPLSHYLLKHIPAFMDLAAIAPAPQASRSHGSSERSQSAEALITRENTHFQQSPLFQVDFAKLIASFSSRQPVGGNLFVANFQGVSDSRASVPAQQSLDLELGSRITSDVPRPLTGAPWFPSSSLGLQSALSYSRSVIGNITNRPINASYSLNNITVGAFLQFRVGGKYGVTPVRGVRSLPRDLIVLTPHQYQVEVNTPYLFFPASGAGSGTGEATIHLPRTSGWTDRAGFRREFGQSQPNAFFKPGSYFETGMEYTVQNAVLSSLTLQTTLNGVTVQKTCQVSARTTLQTCFSQAPSLTITSGTLGFPSVKSLHTPGVYWNIHLQNRLFGKNPAKQVSMVTDTQGDYYFGRPPSAELPTQTEYAIPFSMSLILPSVGNLSFAPTYSAFFYQSQLSSQSLQVNSFSIAARWYFARDARVPVRRQAPLPGPSSADQTRTGSGH